MAKTVTVTLPDNKAVKDRHSIGLKTQSRVVQQAQGGNYTVRVGGSLSASETSMGRLSSALKGVNQALSSYAQMSERKDADALERLRRMSNDKKRELIGAENKVFRQMGLRPTSILQVKESLGTAETGNFSADWQAHLDDELIPQQGRDGSKLTSKQIQTAYTNFRADWAKTKSDVLSQSQLATDGFMSETDNLFDRNAANYVSRADGYYDRAVRDVSIMKDLYTTQDTNPAGLAAKWELLSQSSDVVGMRKAIETIVTDAKLTNTVAGYERAQAMIQTLADPDSGLKLGSQLLSDSVRIEVGLGALEESMRTKVIGMSREERTLQENEDAGFLREARLAQKEYLQALEGAKTDAEKDELTRVFRQTAASHANPIVGGSMIEYANTIEMNQNTLEASIRAAEIKAGTDWSNDNYLPIIEAINSQESPEKIQELVVAAEEALTEASNDGTVSSAQAVELGNKLNEVDTVTSRADLLQSNVDSLVNKTMGTQQDFSRQEYSQQKEVMNSVKEALDIELDERANILEKTGLSASDIQYSFDPNMLTDEASSVFVSLRSDLKDERNRISEQIYLEGAAKSGGKITASMTRAVDEHMATFTETRIQQSTGDLVKLHKQTETKAKAKAAADANLTPDEYEFKENKLRILKKELALETLADRNVFDIDKFNSDGTVSVGFATSFFDLNDKKPFTGRSFHPDHAQYIEAYELMFKEGNNLFEDLDDESKQRLSTRYKEALSLKGVGGLNYRQKLIGKMFEVAQPTPRMSYGQYIFPSTETPKGPNSPEGVMAAEKQLISSYNAGGIDTYEWMNDDYGDERFSLSGPTGDYEQGLGYKYRENIPFVPVETIEKLYNESELDQNDQLFIDTALKKFYMPEGRDREDALAELLDNHKAIYETIHGHSFGDPENITINDTDEDPRRDVITDESLPQSI